MCASNVSSLEFSPKVKDIDIFSDTLDSTWERDEIETGEETKDSVSIDTGISACGVTEVINRFEYIQDSNPSV